MKAGLWCQFETPTSIFASSGSLKTPIPSNLGYISMRDIVIEKVIREDVDPPSLVDEIDSVLREISFELGQLAEEEKEPSGVDAWVDLLREQFWERQFEMVDDRTRFWFRMAAPGFADSEMHLTVSEGGIEIRDEGGVLFRRIPMPDRIDLRTVSATFDRGYLQVAGTKRGPNEQIHLVKQTRKRRKTRTFHEAVHRRHEVGS